MSERLRRTDILEAVAVRLCQVLPVNDAVTQMWWITRSEPEPWRVRRALDLGELRTRSAVRIPGDACSVLVAESSGAPGSLVGRERRMSDAGAANLRNGLRVSTASIAWTTASSALAIAIGVQASSLVLVAFGCTGLLDAAGSVALVLHFRHALKHETFSQRHERAAFLVVTGGLVVVAVATIIESVMRLLAGSPGEQTLAGAGLATVSVVVLTVLARRKIALGRAIPSQALFADGLLSTTGALLAVVTLVGTVLAALGWWWADPVAALLVALGALAVALILARG